jgi:hypothetical protein
LLARPVATAAGAAQHVSVVLSAADFAALIGELESLRRELAEVGAPPARDIHSDTAVAAGAQQLVWALQRSGVAPDRLEQVAALLAVAAALENAVADEDAGP